MMVASGGCDGAGSTVDGDGNCDGVGGTVDVAGNSRLLLKISAMLATAFRSSLPNCSDRNGDFGAGFFKIATRSEVICRRKSSVESSDMGKY